MKPQFTLKPQVYENQHKAAQVFIILKLSYTKSGIELFKPLYIACPTRLMSELAHANP